MEMLVLAAFPILAGAAAWVYFRMNEGAASEYAVEVDGADDAARRMRSIARGLALIWASSVFLFMLFSGAEGFGGGLRGIAINSPNALPGLGFLVCAAIAWRSEAVGGIVLLVEGMLVFAVVPMALNRPASAVPGLVLTLAVPPLIAGFLFLGSWLKSK